MDRARLIGSIILLYIMLLMEYPLPTIVTTVVLIAAYLIIRFAPNLNLGNFSFNQGDKSIRNSRLTALEVASMYLAPYRDIWRDLRLTNKFLSVTLGHDGNRIVITEKVKNNIYSYRVCRVINSKKYSLSRLWDIICLNFDYQTDYNDLTEKLKLLYDATLSEITAGGNVVQPKSVYEQNHETSTHNSINIEKHVNIPKTDINNASEIELTALPGISIVMSKRIIKKREEIRGFKNLNDFFLFIKVKPHMEEQLRNMVCVEKMKGSTSIERFKERKLDL